MNKRLAWLALLAFVSLVGSAAAQDKVAARDPAKTIGPYLDPQTFVVARLDLTRLKAGLLIDQAGQLIPHEPDKFLQTKTMAVGLQQQLLEAGAKEVFFVVSMTDFPQGPPQVVVPLDKATGAAGEQQVVEVLKTLGLKNSARVGDVMVAGSEKAIERHKQLKGAAREASPALAKAFAAGGDVALQVVLLPNDDQRRVVDELMPEFPPQVGGGSTKPFTRGIDWAVLAINGPPKVEVRLVVASPSPEAAQELGKSLTSLLQAVVALPELKQVIPNAADWLKFMSPKVEGNQLTVMLDQSDKQYTLLVESLKIPLSNARQQAQRMQSINNLKQLALAMYNYHDTQNKFPAAFSSDKEGKPLLSWRVHLLPYIEQGPLYEQFHLDEPWDSKHNKPLVAKMPVLFKAPTSKVTGEGKTVYQTLRGEETAFPGKAGMQLKDISDGTSNTVMIVETDDEHAVVWTKPDDFAFDKAQPVKGLGQAADSFVAAFCDGSVRSLLKNLGRAHFNALFTRAGGEVVEQQ